MENSTTNHDNKESTPEEQLIKAVADYQTTKEWRASSSIQERRFVLRTPRADIENNLTANALAGGDKISVPPFVFVDGTRGSVHSFYYLGSGLAGHRGMLHGGVFGVLLDECMGLASFTVLPNHIGVTASLEIAYKAPFHLPGIVVIKAKVDKSEGRKACVIANVESLEGATIFAKAKALFIEPRGAEGMNQLI
jgi:acyl-coenzyme A thioesterase PaaI-like protein